MLVAASRARYPGDLHVPPPLYSMLVHITHLITTCCKTGQLIDRKHYPNQASLMQ